MNVKLQTTIFFLYKKLKMVPPPLFLEGGEGWNKKKNENPYMHHFGSYSKNSETRKMIHFASNSCMRMHFFPFF